MGKKGNEQAAPYIVSLAAIGSLVIVVTYFSPDAKINRSIESRYADNNIRNFIHISVEY